MAVKIRLARHGSKGNPFYRIIVADSRVDLELRVAPDDMGRIIGRQGRTIRAIRSVVKAASVKLGKRVNVEVPD